METKVDLLDVLGRADDVLTSSGREDMHALAGELAEVRAAVVELIATTRAVLPYVATQSVGCHGDKCREPWCYSCFGEEAADEAAVRARDAYHAAHIALARITPAAQESEP